MPYVPVSLYDCMGLGPDGIVTKMFLVYLFIDKEKALQCLKNVGLLWAEMKGSINVSPCRSSHSGLNP